MELIVFDIEVFRHDWIICFYEIVNDKWTTFTTNQNLELIDYIEQHSRTSVLIGYNASFYDSIILGGMLKEYTPQQLKKLNDKLFESRNFGSEVWTLRNFAEKSIHILEAIIGLNRQSLKKLEVDSGVAVVDSALDFDEDRVLSSSEMADAVNYCKWDVVNTLRFVFNNLEKYIAQLSAIDFFKIGWGKSLKTPSQIAAIALGAQKYKEASESYYYKSDVDFQIQKYKHVEDFYNKTLISSGVSYKCDVNNVPHIFGVGGAHGALDKQYFVEDDETVILGLDFDNFYPKIIENFKYLTRGIKDYSRYTHLIDLRNEAKKTGNHDLSLGLKLMLVAVYGSHSYKHSYFYDPEQRFNISITGQLLILSFIEKIESITSLIQTNTDGIYVLIKIKDLRDLQTRIKEWEKDFKIFIEVTRYQAIYQRNVNNYIAVSKNGNVTVRGGLFCLHERINNKTNTLGVTNSRRAVKLGTLLSIVDNKRIEDVIDSLDDALDFQILAALPTRTFDYLVWDIDGVMHRLPRLRASRVFATTETKYGSIYKAKIQDDGSIKFSRAPGLPDQVMIYNEDVRGKKLKNLTFKVDKFWYVKQARKELSFYHARRNFETNIRALI